MLIFPLKKQWYEKIKSGEKTVEYRDCKHYWTKRIYNEIQTYNYENDFDGIKFCKNGDCEFLANFYCYFQLGYKPETRLKAIISKIEIVDGKDTDLKIDKPVYAIHFELCKE